MGIETPVFNNISRVTKFKVYLVNSAGTDIEVGIITNLNPNESRDVTPHFTLGGDAENPKALVGGIVRTKTLTADGFLLYKGSLLTVLGAADVGTGDVFVSLSSQKTPFKIKVIESDPSVGGTGTLSYSYEDCMISDYKQTRDITGTDVRIAESATINYRTISKPTAA